jgi:hypothetical protein
MFAKIRCAYCLTMLFCTLFCFLGCGQAASIEQAATPKEAEPKEKEMKTDQTPDQDNKVGKARTKPGATSKTDVELLQNGKPRSLQPDERAALVAAVENCILSCRDRDKQRVAEPDWQAALKSGSCVSVKYDAEKILDVPSRPGLAVTEILIPLGDAPGFRKIYARKHASIYSPFIQCSDQALEAIDRFR